MKFITEEAIEISGTVQEELHESSNQKVKNYYLEGIFSTPDMKNRNGRVYPKRIWEKEVQRYQKEIRENTVNTLGEIDHPSRTNVDPLKAAIKILKLEMKEGKVYGRAKILNNNSPATNQLKALIDEGMKIGVSSRGVGTVKNGIVEEFKLVTYDCVASPSDFNANLQGVTEGVLQDKEFMLTESGEIEEIKMCSKKECNLYKTEDIQEATKQKFSDFLGELKDSNLSEKSGKDISGVVKNVKFKLKYYDDDDHSVSFSIDRDDFEKQIAEQMTKIVEKAIGKKTKDWSGTNISIPNEWKI